MNAYIRCFPMALILTLSSLHVSGQEIRRSALVDGFTLEYMHRRNAWTANYPILSAEKLDIANGFGEPELRRMTSFKKLETLHIDATGFDLEKGTDFLTPFGNGHLPLQEFESLSNLSLSGYRITNKAAKGLYSLDKLTSLSITRSEIDYEGIKLKLPSLETLEIDGDAPLSFFHEVLKLPELKTLKVHASVSKGLRNLLAGQKRIAIVFPLASVPHKIAKAIKPSQFAEPPRFGMVSLDSVSDDVLLREMRRYDRIQNLSARNSEKQDAEQELKLHLINLSGASRNSFISGREVRMVAREVAARQVTTNSSGYLLFMRLDYEIKAARKHVKEVFHDKPDIRDAFVSSYENAYRNIFGASELKRLQEESTE